MHLTTNYATSFANVCERIAANTKLFVDDFCLSALLQNRLKKKAIFSSNVTGY